ncbi:hypothetical protein PybrP1_003379 [[Pythium] brassicae (nom. inval.)]|nr:hypothetical protein PybrP1_003379 [[Pythium] brassicae (nom. inval.)]
MLRTLLLLRPRSPPRHLLRAAASSTSLAADASTKRNVFITTPIFYVNASPHIGHVHSAVLADALARWFRVRRRAVVFSTGTDEHGLKVQEAAEAAGTTDYKSFCDDVSGRFDAIFRRCNVASSRFIRTSDSDHHEAVAALWRRLERNGHIYLGEHEAWYCKSDESFLTETQVEDRTDARGRSFKVSKESGHVVEKVREENYKFRLSAFQDELLAWLDGGVVVPPSRANEVRAAVAAGLRDVSVSRLREKIQWAITVPGDDSHCVYVWLDALTNYLTVAGYPGDTSATWPADYHVVGKDILKFHAIYWPAFLLAAGLPLPKRVVAHAHWTVANVKMSKSLGNVVDPDELLAQYGADAVRYFLLREGVLNDDGDFNAGLLEDRVNSELADTLGNLVSRSTGKSFLRDGVVPTRPKTLRDDDRELVAHGQQLAARVAACFEAPDFSAGLKEIVFFLHDVNRYFSANEPWVLAKQLRVLAPDSPESAALQERLDTVLYVTIDAVRMSAILLQPAVPDAAAKILDYLGVPPASRSFDEATMMLEPSLLAEFIGARVDNSRSFVAFPKLLK